MLDSAQLYPLIPKQARSLVDLGSGAGFPGLVLAILAIGRAPELAVHLIESDHKKAAFLKEAARQTQAKAIIHAGRIETLDPLPADLITARALAPMGLLLELSERFWSQDTVGLFLKGQDVDIELTEAGNFESMEIRQHQSRSDPKGRILEIRRRGSSEGVGA